MGKNIKRTVEEETRELGIEMIGMKIKDNPLPEKIKRILAGQAVSTRSRRFAIIISFEEDPATRRH